MGAARETVGVLRAPTVALGAGAAAEAGVHLAELGVGHVLLVTDAFLVEHEPVAAVAEAVAAEGVRVTWHVIPTGEPTEHVMQAAGEAAIAASPAACMTCSVGSPVGITCHVTRTPSAATASATAATGSCSTRNASVTSSTWPTPSSARCTPASAAAPAPSATVGARSTPTVSRAAPTARPSSRPR